MCCSLILFWIYFSNWVSSLGLKNGNSIIQGLLKLPPERVQDSVVQRNIVIKFHRTRRDAYQKKLLHTFTAKVINQFTKSNGLSKVEKTGCNENLQRKCFSQSYPAIIITRRDFATCISSQTKLHCPTYKEAQSKVSQD